TGYEASISRQIGLQRQLDDLMMKFDRDIQAVTRDSNKLDTSWATFFARMRVDVRDFSTNFRVQMQNSIESVNQGMANAVTSWISMNKSFGASMRELGVQILNDFVSMFIRIGLEWLELHLGMKAVQSVSAADRVISEAAVAGASGTASWAGAPWPIDAYAPAFGAQMMEAALAYLPMATAAEGGIVHVGLH